MKSVYFCLIYVLCFNCGQSTFICPHRHIKKLGCYGGNASLVSMSGFSSGAIFSAHYHIAFSKEIMGVGLIAGVPMFCAFKANRTGLNAIYCSQSCFFNRYSDIISVIKDYAEKHLIDPVEEMAGDKVSILHGALDTISNPLNALQIWAIYKAFDCDIKIKFLRLAEHAMITNEVKIPHCPLVTPFFLTNCNYDAAYQVLNHIYGNLSKPTCNMTLAGELYPFDQGEFTAPLTPYDLSMADYGYVYVPSHCKNNTGCRVHVASHGCGMGGQPPYEQYVKYSGYNDVAEVNNINIIYPQMIGRLPQPGTPGFDQHQPFNPLACHDWIGYTTPLYAAKTAPQLQTYRKMIQRALSICDE